MPAIDPEAKQISRAEMEALIATRFPTMSPPNKAALLSGSVLELASGEKYQAPLVEHDRPTHTVEGLMGRRDSPEWNN